MHFRFLGLAITLMLLVCSSRNLAQPDPEPVLDGKRLSEWVQQLKSGNEADRPRAAEAIGSLARQAQGVVPAVLAGVMDKETGKPNEAAMKAIAQMGQPAVAPLTRALWSEDFPTRVVAIHILRFLGDKAKPAVPSLIELLNDDDAFLRRSAADALGEIRERAAIPALLPLLQKPDVEMQRAALGSLLNIDVEARAVLPTLNQWLQADGASQRFIAVAALDRLGREATPAVGALVKAMDDDDGRIRSAAIEALGRIGPAAKAAVPALKAALQNEKRQEGRLAAASSLWIIAQHPDVVPALKSLVKDSKASQQLLAANLLWRIDKSPEAVATLANVLKNGAEADRRTAAELLRPIGPGAKSVVPTLLPLLKDKDVVVRVNAIVTLGRIGPPAKEAVDTLTAAVNDEDSSIRLASQLALWKIQKDPTVLGRLGLMALAKDPEERRTVAYFHGLIGPAARKAVPFLLVALKDTDVRVRIEAAQALWEIEQNPAALTTLIAVLSDKNPANRSDAAVRLGTLCRGDAKSVAALRLALWDADSSVRSMAAEALGRIGPESKSAVRALIAVLKGDEEDHVISAAADAVGQIGPEARDAEAVLLDRLRHPDSYVRVHAALALWTVKKNPAGLAVATEGLQNRKVRVRVVAAEALWHMKQQPKAVESLLEVLREASLRDEPATSNEQYMAARALMRIGPPAKACFSLLLDLVNHEDDYLRLTAAAALKRIDPEAARKANVP